MLDDFQQSINEIYFYQKKKKVLTLTGASKYLVIYSTNLFTSPTNNDA